MIAITASARSARARTPNVDAASSPETTSRPDALELDFVLVGGRGPRFEDTPRVGAAREKVEHGAAGLVREAERVLRPRCRAPAAAAGARPDQHGAPDARNRLPSLLDGASSPASASAAPAAGAGTVPRAPIVTISAP